MREPEVSSLLPSSNFTSPVGTGPEAPETVTANCGTQHVFAAMEIVESDTNEATFSAAVTVDGDADGAGCRVVRVPAVCGG